MKTRAVVAIETKKLLEADLDGPMAGEVRDEVNSGFDLMHAGEIIRNLGIL